MGLSFSLVDMERLSQVHCRTELQLPQFLLCKRVCLNQLAHILLITDNWVDHLKCGQNRLSSSGKVVLFCCSFQVVFFDWFATGCCRIFAASLEKKKNEIWPGVKNSEVAKRRFHFSASFGSTHFFCDNFRIHFPFSILPDVEFGN